MALRLLKPLKAHLAVSGHAGSRDARNNLKVCHAPFTDQSGEHAVSFWSPPVVPYAAGVGEDVKAWRRSYRLKKPEEEGPPWEAMAARFKVQRTAGLVFGQRHRPWDSLANAELEHRASQGARQKVAKAALRFSQNSVSGV